MSDWIDSYRVTVFVPLEALEGFVKAVSPHIPAFLGGYDHVCWWAQTGVEQSRERPDGMIEQIPAARFECSLPKDRALLERFIKETVKPAHPWKEPVILVHGAEIRRPG